jgi:hypothetical protein
MKPLSINANAPKSEGNMDNRKQLRKNKKVAYPERIRCNQMENDMAV